MFFTNFYIQGWISHRGKMAEAPGHWILRGPKNDIEYFFSDCNYYKSRFFASKGAQQHNSAQWMKNKEQEVC